MVSRFSLYAVLYIEIINSHLPAKSLILKDMAPFRKKEQIVRGEKEKSKKHSTVAQ
jgi:hypothetical protein